GALKRSGASGVPAWATIVGKIIAVFAMVCLQVVVLGTASFLLGFRAPLTGVLLAFVVLLLGVAAFTALCLTLGGSLSAEIVLALSNRMLLVLLALVRCPPYAQGLVDVGWLSFIPSVALASGLAEALSGSFPITPVISMFVIAIVASF